MRQYKLFYKRLGAEKFTPLEPGAHKAIYDREEVNAAIALIKERSFLEGAVVRIADELFNVIAFTQDALAPNAFEFEG